MTIGLLSSVLAAPQSGAPLPPPNVMLWGDASTGVNMTQTMWNQLAAWGFGSVSMSVQFPYNGSFNFGQVTNAFKSTPAVGSTGNMQRALATQAGYAHNAGMKIYLGVSIINYFATATGSQNPSPLLGGWKSTFTDSKGQTYANWNATFNSLGAACAQMGFDGMTWDTEWGAINPGTSFPTWQYAYSGHGTDSQSTVNSQAQTQGAAMMSNVQSGWSGNGGSGALPVVIYMSNVVGYPQFVGGYFQTLETFLGNTTTAAAVNTSVWGSFVAGIASATTGPVVCADATMYYTANITSGPYSGSGTTSAWAQAIAKDASALAALSLPANVYITPFIWPADQSGNGGTTWSQSSWNAAIPSILGGVQDGIYLIFQFSKLVTSGALSINYADNTFTGGGGADYHPVNS